MYDHIFQRLKQSKYVIPLIVMTILILLTLVYLTSRSPEDTRDVPPTSEISQINSSEESNASKQETPPITDIVVDIKGAVANPQTYMMKSSDRVNDLLKKAGVLKNADLSQINLAEKLMDQKMIYIPTKGEKAYPPVTQSLMNSESESEIQPVNLNLAEMTDLTKIPGIGPSKAETIIKYREEKGAFKSVDELKEIKGIGEKTFEKLKAYFVV